MIQLLKDPETFPSSKILQQALGENYIVFEKLIKLLSGTPYSLNPQWNYYKDGKSWLCKILHKKKTVLWLSVWEEYFMASFYFTEKDRTEINERRIDANIKTDFNERKPIGKLLPLVISVHDIKQIDDILNITDYKLKRVN
jgi:hypothetical protein